MVLVRTPLLPVLAEDEIGLPNVPRQNAAPARNELHIPQVKVAIVGAGGFAGQGCATELSLVGLIPERFEANNRLGGRVHTVTDPDGTVRECGGELINDDHRAILNAAHSLDVPLRMLFDEKQTACILAYHIDKEYHASKKLSAAIRPLAKIIAADLNALNGDNPEEVRKRLDTLSAYDYLAEADIPGWALRTLACNATAELGRDASELSALSLLGLHFEREELDLPGYGKYTVRGGMSRLIEALNAQVEGDMQFEHRLTAIKKRDQGFELIYDHNGERVSTFADLVVICIPYSVLRNVDLSEAGLSDVRMRAIQELPYGTEGKIHIKGSDPAANAAVSQAGPAASVTLVDDFGGAPAYVWNDQRREDLPSHLRTIYTSDIATLREQYGDEALEQMARVKLDQMFPEGRHDGDAHIVDWTKDEFAQGSYASPKPGQRTELAQGFTSSDSPGIYFAGEHINSAYPGFMEGAFRTGQFAAAQLLGDVLLNRRYWEAVVAKRNLSLVNSPLRQRELVSS